jgi:hypothetical protein
MSDLTKFSDGASILQQVDVSDIFKNLALGIAEAQQKLDDNSIAQAIKLAETQINGVSLLELGFAPVFYAFQYADISASINLKMALKESLEFGFGLDLQIASNKGYTQDTHDFLSEDSYSETSEEYKTSRQVSFRAKEKKAVKINNKFVKQSESLAAKSRLEKFKYDIVHEASVDQVYEEIHSRKLTNDQSRGVDVWMDRGFLRIEGGLHFAADGVGIFKISDFSAGTGIDVDGAATVSTTFGLANFNSTFLDLATDTSNSQVYGLTKTGDLYTLVGGTWIPVSSKMYFGYNSDEITYGKNLKDGAGDSANVDYPSTLTGADQNENHNYHILVHKALRLVQAKDPDASIKITGMTDPKGGDNPKNKSLATRRAERLRDHIFGSDATIDVEIDAVTNTAGSSDLTKRYAKIELDSDYLIFVGGSMTSAAIPGKTATTPNKFIYADDSGSTGGAFNQLNVMYGSDHLNYTATTSSSDTMIDSISILENSKEKTSEGLHYFIDDEAIVKLSMYTNESDEIAIEESSEGGSEGTEESTSYLWSKSKNEKSKLSDATSKKSQDNSFALGASVDFRMSRQFEMSMEGNASMSARLVAVPAPQNFVVFLQNVYVNQTTEE